MNLLSIIGGQWAITPNKLLEISNIYSAHLRGEKSDLVAIETKIGKPLQNHTQQADYALQDGVAIIRLEGIIAKRMNLMTQISGGTSSQLAAQSLQAAIGDPAVHSIILAIDSPGGTVDGTQILSDQVLAARRSGKPVVTLGSGAMASAAYWIGSAAQAVYITDATTQVGSIGVVATHTDVSGSQEKQGIKTTEIAAGKYKRIASQYGPLTADGKQTIQDQVDYTYALFVDAVAKHRGTSSQTVLQKMADGRVFVGQQAIDAGLVDGFATLDDLVQRLNADRKSGKTSLVAKPARPLTRLELDQQAKAYMLEHPETDYLAAIKTIAPEMA